MPVTKIRSKWVAGLLRFFKAADGAEVFKITETGIESPAITGTITGTQKGAIIGSLALSRADDYALTAAEKANLVFLITLTEASKTVTLGLSAGQVAFVHNAGPTNAFTVKNVADDAGTPLAAGKTLLVIGSATADASTVIALN
jgi:hypothetical protein